MVGKRSGFLGELIRVCMENPEEERLFFSARFGLMNVEVYIYSRL